MEDYSHRVGTACIVLILMLLGIGYIPAFTVGSVEFKRIDIISDLRSVDDFSREVISPLELNESEYDIDMESLATSVAHTRELLAQHSPIEAEPELIEDVEVEVENLPMIRQSIDSLIPLQGVTMTPIENFDTTATNPFRRLYTKLNNPSATVRIALLGDSFVEGDILSGDLRAVLQQRYGGQGAGFAPFDSPLTRYRRTIKTTSSGWTTYNIMQKRTTPEPLNQNYCVSGWVSTPEVGAVTRWQGSDNRKGVESWRSARVLFLSPHKSTLEVVVNDSLTTRYNIEGQEMLQQLHITHDSMTSLSVKVVAGAKDFVGYGAIFDGGDKGGISVDNYSVRSNNGQAILWTNPSINYQVDYAIGGYDLVILQYGLNIMQRGVTNYTRYSQQVEKIIAYVRECFPSAAILVMGVSDRSIKESGTYKPMSEATQMTHYQRQAAQNTLSAFWSTYDAMQARGGMPYFVQQGWAGKDFTHINFAGGRELSYALAQALIYGHLSAFGGVERHDFERVIPESALKVTHSFEELEAYGL